MFIHWLVDVSKEGKVTSKMDLLTKIPERGETWQAKTEVKGHSKCL